MRCQLRRYLNKYLNKIRGLEWAPTASRPRGSQPILTLKWLGAPVAAPRRTDESMDKGWLVAGAACEVLMQEEGLWGSHYTAKILEVPKQKSKIEFEVRNAPDTSLVTHPLGLRGRSEQRTVTATHLKHTPQPGSHVFCTASVDGIAAHPRPGPCRPFMRRARR